MQQEENSQIEGNTQRLRLAVGTCILGSFRGAFQITAPTGPTKKPKPDMHAQNQVNLSTLRIAQLGALNPQPLLDFVENHHVAIRDIVPREVDVARGVAHLCCTASGLL